MSFRSCMCVLISMFLSLTKSQWDGFSTENSRRSTSQRYRARRPSQAAFGPESYPPPRPTGTDALSLSDLEPQSLCSRRSRQMGCSPEKQKNPRMSDVSAGLKHINQDRLCHPCFYSSVWSSWCFGGWNQQQDLLCSGGTITGPSLPHWNL